MTKVVFRKLKDGQVIALFPQETASRDGYECMSYMHVGQHGSADPMIVHDTKPATPREYAPLVAELLSIGYRLDIRKKFGRKDYNVRRERARLWKN